MQSDISVLFLPKYVLPGDAFGFNGVTIKRSTGSVSASVSVQARAHYRKPALQLWSCFLTLLRSLSWALVREQASEACCGLGLLGSISSSESSSSLSLSIFSSACLFSSLGPRVHKLNVNTTTDLQR